MTEYEWLYREYAVERYLGKIEEVLGYHFVEPYREELEGYAEKLIESFGAEVPSTAIAKILLQPMVVSSGIILCLSLFYVDYLRQGGKKTW